MRYTVDIKEVHNNCVIVDTEEEGLSDNPAREELTAAAERIAGEADELNLEYGHTLPADVWTIRDETGEFI